jgi:hypothetical protein
MMYIPFGCASGDIDPKPEMFMLKHTIMAMCPQSVQRDSFHVALTMFVRLTWKFDIKKNWTNEKAYYNVTTR